MEDPAQHVAYLARTGIGSISNQLLIEDRRYRFNNVLPRRRASPLDGVEGKGKRRALEEAGVTNHLAFKGGTWLRKAVLVPRANARMVRCWR